MEFLLNELSLHGQFNSSLEFANAASSVMAIRQSIKEAGRELYCNRNLAVRSVCPSILMPEAMAGLSLNDRRAWMSWLTKGGPFWLDKREHADDEWLEVSGEMVTDSAIGEAAFCLANELPRQLISFSPSAWESTPVSVTWRQGADLETDVEVRNHWTLETVVPELENLPAPFYSWQTLGEHLQSSSPELIFSEGFMRMNGYPYVKSVANGIFLLAQVLNKLAKNVDADGHRNEQYKVLYETYFMGTAPYFTDESQGNKTKFAAEMTFEETGAERRFCPWHGKVNSPSSFPPIRIHFAWPMQGKEKILVPYIGKKITM